MGREPMSGHLFVPCRLQPRAPAVDRRFYGFEIIGSQIHQRGWTLRT